MPKVSIIVPVYNTEQYLERCLHSLVNQTLEDIEILVIDDGSTDESAEVAKQFLVEYENKIVFIQKPRNSGQSDSRNMALKQSRGKYILYVDSDDFLLAEACEALFNFSEVNNTEVSGFLMNEFHNDSEIELIPRVVEATPGYDNLSGEMAFYHDWILYNKRNVQATLFFYSKDFLLANDLFYEVGKLHEDLEYYFHMISLAKRVGFVNKTFYQRNIRENSTTTSKEKAWIKKRLLDRKQMLKKCYIHIKNFSNIKIQKCAKACLDFLNGPYLNLIILKPYVKILNSSDKKEVKSSNSLNLWNYRFLLIRFWNRMWFSDEK
ncbi:glycosyltransferase family 2 protein [Culicoidibacter larvae]|uniref:Glycosyltransferase family 2 protein n=1 Tax=Culicoidibacter larvae TaxID=2579976 RepID=A0A5R8QD87_9FIRM|nr:glycosyltransferase family 2 protein [Culicoidibacter larvae]TLG75237.1 glycosyltransferase family 2 protein [Culicoidibacter larvae]